MQASLSQPTSPSDARVWDAITDRYSAGEILVSLADDFNMSIEQVEAAIRWGIRERNAWIDRRCDDEGGPFRTLAADAPLPEGVLERLRSRAVSIGSTYLEKIPAKQRGFVYDAILYALEAEYRRYGTFHVSPERFDAAVKAFAAASGFNWEDLTNAGDLYPMMAKAFEAAGIPIGE